MSEIASNIAEITKKIESAALKAGRNPPDIVLEAVVKNVPLNLIFEAIDCGIGVIGESKVQEANSRYREIRRRFPRVKLHMIGHLQTNKINQALEMFDVFESVDSFHLAFAIASRAKRPVEVFVEVNTSGEESKFGVPPQNALDLILKVSKLENLKLAGLMTISQLAGSEDETRKCFRLLRKIRDDAEKSGVSGLKLSMGMSDDFLVAIEEGSDIIRVGRSIFQNRR